MHALDDINRMNMDEAPQMGKGATLHMSKGEETIVVWKAGYDDDYNITAFNERESAELYSAIEREIVRMCMKNNRPEFTEEDFPENCPYIVLAIESS